ncbi:MAG: HgcAB-associated protein HgcC [Candidatus Hadarchaeia archaeon]
MSEEKSGGDECRCKIESVVSIDERGQMVLPKGIREKVGIEPGSKLAVVSMKKGGNVCCISLMRTEELEKMVGEKLEPLIGNL